MGGLSTFSPLAALKRRSFFNGANVIYLMNVKKCVLPQEIAMHDRVSVKLAVEMQVENGIPVE